MARLYPPITEEVLPAFCLTYDSQGQKAGATIKINFNLNRAVSKTEIKGMALRLRTISTNQYVVTENLVENPSIGAGGRSEGEALSFDLTNGSCIFQITNTYNPESVKLLKVGQYYKAQVAFIDLNDNIGYWSTVATIKCIAKPSVTIANYHYGDINVFSSKIIGEYKQDTTTGDSSEKVYSYQFKLYKPDGETIFDQTEVLLHNSTEDVYSDSSTDIFHCYKELNENEVYFIEYSITTINGYYASSPKYQIINIDTIDTEEKIKIVVEDGLQDSYQRNSWLPWEEGVLKIYLDFIDKKDAGKGLIGNFVILRSSSKDNFEEWQEIRRFRLNGEKPSEKFLYDYTIEQGIKYKYAIQQFNRQGFYSKKVYFCDDPENDRYNKNAAKLISANFEDMFLYDGKRQLKIRFNPKVSSFKNDLQEQKIDTIGSKFPFIFRNGNVCYKEFPIAGLISFQEDNAYFYINEEDERQMDLQRFDNKYRTDTLNEKNQSELIKQRESTYSKTDLTSENITSERYFKLSVLDWLTDGKPKLFRSPTEGNYIVRLLNVSLSPKDQLGRMLHEFTCTAYEIADFNYQSLIDLGLLSINDFDERGRIWESYNIKDLLSFPINEQDDEGNSYYSVDLDNRELYGFQCTGFAPGDKIKIITINDSTPIIITIGQTGTYIYESAEPIISLSIAPQSDTKDFPRALLLELRGYKYQKFDDIAAFNIYTEIGEQIVGQHENIFESTIVRSKRNLDSTNYAKIKRPLRVKRYQESNNVYLNETFSNLCEGIGQDRYDQNWFYFIKDGKYILPETDPGIGIRTTQYSDNIPYYKRNLDLIENAAKLQVSELLYLHAKRRERIPIFIYNSNPANMNDLDYNLDQYMSEVKFSLTPFGQGYVHYKAISPDLDSNIYSVLTEEERTQALEIKDLVDFTIEKCHLDKFCLFEVYAPVPRENSDIIDWIPYCTANHGVLPWGGSQNAGIFDPYLYEKEANNTRDDVVIRGALGWWRKRGNEYETYDPTFTIGYGEGENETIETISLADKPELTLKNIKLPYRLSTGTGVVIEVIYRLKYIDYTVENENKKVRQAKVDYLATKKDALKRISNYRTANYIQMVGEWLQEKYKQGVIQPDSDIIKILVETAREQQINLILRYLQKEKQLVVTVINELYNIDSELRQNLGTDYIVNYSFINKLNEAKQKYFTFVNNILQENKEEILKPIEYYEKNYISSSQAKQMVKEESDKYFDNITKNSWDFFKIINEIQQMLTNQYNECAEQINDLDIKQYVAQYIDLLEQKGSQIFFNQTDFENYENNYPIGKWIHKNNPDISLSTTNVESSVWENYFHVGENDNLLPKLGNIKSTKDYSYEVPHLNDYIDNTLNINKSTSKLFTERVITYNENEPTNTNKTIITLINEVLQNLINYYSGTNNKEAYYNKWKIVWNPNPAGINLTKNKIQIGKINTNCTIDISDLEQIINNGFMGEYLDNPPEKADITAVLNRWELYKSMPLALQNQLIDIVQAYIISDIRKIFQKACTIYSYLDNNQYNLTTDQIQIIKHQLLLYQEEIESDKDWNDIFNLNNSTSQLSSFWDNDWKDWYKDWKNVKDHSADDTTLNNLINQGNSYIAIFNNIIDQKNNAINEFLEAKDKIINLKNNPNVTPSTQLRIALEEQQDQYLIANNNVNAIEIYFIKQYEIWRQESMDNNITNENNNYPNFIVKIKKQSKGQNVTMTYFTESNNIVINNVDINTVEKGKNIIIQGPEGILDDYIVINNSFENKIKVIFKGDPTNSDGEYPEGPLSIISTAYQDFLGSYLDILNADNSIFNSDQYKQYLQWASAMRDYQLSEDDRPIAQHERIKNAWKEFLDILFINYKKMS